MASKPDKYGQKYWLAVDKESKYIVNEFLYVEKDNLRSKTERVSGHVIVKLAEPYLKKGRNIMTDNYFTSTKLAILLKSKNTSLLGTKESWKAKEKRFVAKHSAHKYCYRRKQEENPRNSKVL